MHSAVVARVICCCCSLQGTIVNVDDADQALCTSAVVARLQGTIVNVDDVDQARTSAVVARLQGTISVGRSGHDTQIFTDIGVYKVGTWHPTRVQFLNGKLNVQDILDILRVETTLESIFIFNWEVSHFPT